MNCGRTTKAPTGCGKRKSTDTQPEINSYAEVVAEYLKFDDKNLAIQIESFKNSASLGDAIERAALALDSAGKRYSHQRRIPKAALRKAKDRLLKNEAQLKSCKDFDELFKLVEHEIKGIHGVGELVVYDTALHISHYLERPPDKIYLHAGARKGAKALKIKIKNSRTRIEDMPIEFRGLRAEQIENCLCIYKEDLERIRSALGA
jgi:hypothetical protein